MNKALRNSGTLPVGRGRPAVPEAELREKIQHAAFVLLREKDMAALSVDEIARTAGVAKKTFYRFYSNRDDLLEKLILTWSSTLTLYNLPIPENSHSVMPLLEQFFIALAERALSDKAVALFKFLQNNPADKTHLLTLYRESGIDNASRMLDIWLLTLRNQGLIASSWPDKGAKHLQALIIAPMLRDIALGILPAVPALDIRPRIVEALSLVSPLLTLPTAR